MPLNLNHPQEALLSQSRIERICANLVPNLAPTVRCNEGGALFLTTGFASSSSLSSPYSSLFCKGLFTLSFSAIQLLRKGPI